MFDSHILSFILAGTWSSFVRLASEKHSTNSTYPCLVFIHLHKYMICASRQLPFEYLSSLSAIERNFSRNKCNLFTCSVNKMQLTQSDTCFSRQTVSEKDKLNDHSSLEHKHYVSCSPVFIVRDKEKALRNTNKNRLLCMLNQYLC